MKLSVSYYWTESYYYTSGYRHDYVEVPEDKITEKVVEDIKEICKDRIYNQPLTVNKNFINIFPINIIKLDE